MEYEAKAGVNANYANQIGAAKPQTASEGIVDRLNNLRMNLSESRSSANHAADKIVGSAPTPISNSTGQIVKGERPPVSCFIDALQQVISDLESIASDTQETLSRLHRSF